MNDFSCAMSAFLNVLSSSPSSTSQNEQACFTLSLSSGRNNRPSLTNPRCDGTSDLNHLVLPRYCAPWNTSTPGADMPAGAQAAATAAIIHRFINVSFSDWSSPLATTVSNSDCNRLTLSHG